MPSVLTVVTAGKAGRHRLARSSIFSSQSFSFANFA